MIKREALFSSASDEWETPHELFDKLNDEFHFTIDVCASEWNAKVIRYYTKEQNGLNQDWTGETVWCNPPYGRQVKAWIQKAFKHFVGGVLRFCWFLQGQILHGFMSMFTGKQKYVLSGDG